MARAPRYLPLGLLVLALAVVYGPFVASGGLLAVGDGLGYYFPVRVLAALSLRMGEWPFWNPVNFAGMPLHGMLQAGIFFPGNWGFLALPPVAAMNLAVLLPSLVAGGAMYAFVRANELGRLPGLVAALPYMLGGYLAAHLEELTSVQVVALIPAVLWAVERFARTRDGRYALAASALWALQLLAGYPQTSLITLAIAAAYAWHRRAPALPLAAAAALGLAIAAVELVPVLDILAQSSRLQLPYQEVVRYSLPVRQLPTLVFPYMFGGPAGPLFHVRYWGAGEFFSELMGYVGLAPLLLASVAAARRVPPVRFWLGLGLVGLVLALGDATPIYHLWAKIPIVRAIRVPGRHLLELDLALCMLAAYGLDALIKLEAAPRIRLVRRVVLGWSAGLAAFLLALGLGHDALAARLGRWLPPGFDIGGALALSQPAFWVPVVLFALTAATLWRFRPAALVLVLFVDLAIYAREQSVLVHGPRPGPLAMALPDAPYRSLPLARSYPYPDLARARALAYPTFAAFWGERSASGYEAFVPDRYARLVGGVDNGGLVTDLALFAPANHVLDVLGVRTLHLDPLGAPALPSGRWLPGPAGTRVNPRALPRAWRVAAARTAAADEVDRTLASDPAFEPARLALVEDGPAPTGLAAGSASCRAPSPNRLVVETTGPGPGLVVVNERFDPGWHARLAGGSELPIRRADALVMAIAVPAGAQTIELAYLPPGWAASAAASLAGLLAWLAWALGARARRAR